MEALIAAVDAAGQRSRRQLPTVIDGLNEAEDPRDWKGPLASLDEILRRYSTKLTIRKQDAGESFGQRHKVFQSVKRLEGSRIVNG